MGIQLQRPSSSGQLPSWFGVPFLLGGLLFIGFGIVLLTDELRYGNEGATTTAVVVEKNYSPGGEDSGATYEFRYQFLDPATGSLHEGSSDVSEDTYDATALGAGVQVTYLPADPTKSRVGPPDPQLFEPLLVMGGGAIFLVVGAGLLVIVPRLRRRASVESASVAAGIPYDPPPDPAVSMVIDAPPAVDHRPVTEAELRAIDARLAPPATGSPAPPSEVTEPGGERPPAG